MRWYFYNDEASLILYINTTIKTEVFSGPTSSRPAPFAKALRSFKVRPDGRILRRPKTKGESFLHYLEIF